MARFVLMMLFCLTFVTNPVQQQSHQSFSTHFDKEATISAHLYLTDASMILDVVPSLVHKQEGIPQSKITLPPALHYELKPFGRTSICLEIYPDSFGFLEVVRTHSNYL
ncbi:hypothetical protein [Rossellomorea aquimaris]|uniref:hypothetical protein n=1 Tax=Rossellomorea aquimaris TaxID=189382 RepID=UPI001CFE3D76|nr:hypothetical protein [Rossellomorea aquimaris]